jgi:hypothetical protein
MVLYVMKWAIMPGKMEDYGNGVQGAIKRLLSMPDCEIKEFRAYRPATGDYQVVAIYEFTDFAAWAVFYSNEEVQKINAELRAFTDNLSAELWGPSPVVPQPIRPGG